MKCQRCDRTTDDLTGGICEGCIRESLTAALHDPPPKEPPEPTPEENEGNDLLDAPHSYTVSD